MRASILKAKFREYRKVYPCASQIGFFNSELAKVDRSITKRIREYFSSEVNAKLKSIVPGPNLFKDINRIFPVHDPLRPVV